MSLIGSLRSFLQTRREQQRLKRELAAWQHQFENNLNARKEARRNGQTYVAGYVRKRGTA